MLLWVGMCFRRRRNLSTCQRAPPRLCALSSACSDRRSKYQLQQIVRTNLAASDAAYGCVFESEDEAGVRGVKLSKELMSVAGAA